MHRLLAGPLLLLLILAAPLGAQQPWWSSELGLERDNQVRTALRAAVERGWYLGRDVTLALRGGGSRAAGEAPSGTAPATSWASLGMAGTLAFPSARTGLMAGADALLGLPASAGGTGAAWEGHAALRHDLGHAAALRLQAARDRYTATLSSLDTTVFASTVEIALDRKGAPGWAWEAVARDTRFGDGNPVRTAFAWALAPLSRSAAHSVRIGYAVAWQDASRSTWRPSGAKPAGAFPQQVPGWYAPYYSPHDVTTHSVLFNGAHTMARGWLLVDRSLGARATETAPLLVRTSAAGAPQLTFYERSFTPWKARAALVVPADDRSSVTLELSYERTAYYRMVALRLALARSL